MKILKTAMDWAGMLAVCAEGTRVLLQDVDGMFPAKAEINSDGHLVVTPHKDADVK